MIIVTEQYQQKNVKALSPSDSHVSSSETDVGHPVWKTCFSSTSQNVTLKVYWWCEDATLTLNYIRCLACRESADRSSKHSTLNKHKSLAAMRDGEYTTRQIFLDKLQTSPTLTVMNSVELPKQQGPTYKMLKFAEIRVISGLTRAGILVPGRRSK